jgi:hypothetical protein
MAWVRIEIHEPSDRDGFEKIPLALETATTIVHKMLADGEHMGILEFSKDEFQRLLHPVNVVTQIADSAHVVGQFAFRAYNRQMLDAEADAADLPDLRPA